MVLMQMTQQKVNPAAPFLSLHKGLAQTGKPGAGIQHQQVIFLFQRDTACVAAILQTVGKRGGRRAAHSPYPDIPGMLRHIDSSFDRIPSKDHTSKGSFFPLSGSLPTALA